MFYYCRLISLSSSCWLFPHVSWSSYTDSKRHIDFRQGGETALALVRQNSGRAPRCSRRSRSGRCSNWQSSEGFDCIGGDVLAMISVTARGFARNMKQSTLRRGAGYEDGLTFRLTTRLAWAVELDHRVLNNWLNEYPCFPVSALQAWM